MHDFQLAPRMREARVGARGVWRQIWALVKFSAQYISRLQRADFGTKLNISSRSVDLSHKKWTSYNICWWQIKNMSEKFKISLCRPRLAEKPRWNANNASYWKESLISHRSVPPCPSQNELDGFGNVGKSTRRGHRPMLNKFSIDY